MLREAHRNDVSRIRDILERTLEPLDIYAPVSRQQQLDELSISALTALLVSEPGSIIVFEDQGTIDGFVLVRDDRQTLYIQWVCVAPDARRKGIGPRLYKAAFEAGHKRGFHKIWGITLASNRSSLSFLPRIGCRKVCELKNYWYGQDYIFWEYMGEARLPSLS